VFQEEKELLLIEASRSYRLAARRSVTWPIAGKLNAHEKSRLL